MRHLSINHQHPSSKKESARFALRRTSRSFALKNGFVSLWKTPWKLIFLFVYVMLCIFFWNQQDILFPAENYGILAPLIKPLTVHILLLYFVILFFICIGMIGYPWGRRKLTYNFQRIGLVNAMGEVPLLLGTAKDSVTKDGLIYYLSPAGLAEEDFLEMKPRIETILNRLIVDTKWKNGRKIFCLYTVPAISELPNCIYWNDPKPRDTKNYPLVVGFGYQGPVCIHLGITPHVLIGGTTGSGKTALLKGLLMQCIDKGAEVYVADFKGGSDFAAPWCNALHMVFTFEALDALLETLVCTLDERMNLFRQHKCNSLEELNKRCHADYKRIIFACDEIAEVLDRTSRSKSERELIDKIEFKFSRLARLGRGFAIHLIVATQRPDAKLMDGQFRDNFDCRICGRAPWNLSKVILGNLSAAEEIPKDTPGRFLMHDGTVFQAYMFDEGNTIPLSEADAMGIEPVDVTDLLKIFDANIEEIDRKKDEK